MENNIVIFSDRKYLKQTIIFYYQYCNHNYNIQGVSYRCVRLLIEGDMGHTYTIMNKKLCFIMFIRKLD